MPGVEYGFRGDPSRGMAFKQYLPMMLDRLWLYGISVASFVCACVLQRSRIGVKHEYVVTLDNDMPEVIKRSKASDLMYWAGVLVGFILCCSS